MQGSVGVGFWELSGCMLLSIPALGAWLALASRDRR
jgi:hypothetical protein